MKTMCSETFLQVLDKLATLQNRNQQLSHANGGTQHLDASKEWKSIIEILSADQMPHIKWNHYKKHFELYPRLQLFLLYMIFSFSLLGLLIQNRYLVQRNIDRIPY
jgi:hypothetical protein